MRYIRYAFLAVLGIVLISVSMANRGAVTLQLVPDDIAGLLGWNFSISLPLFVVVLGGIASGLVIGFVWEWMREARLRRTAVRSTRKAAKLEAEVKSLRQEKEGPKDDVLALLEQPSR